MTNFKITSALNPAQWSSFVYEHPNGNVFQTPEMYKVYKNTKNYEPIFLAVINDKNEILGTLLAVIQKEYSGFLGNFTARSIIFGGPLIKNNDADILDFILQEYNKIIRKKAIYSQFRNMWEWRDLKEIFIKNGFEYEEHLDIIHDLTLTQEEMFEKMHKGRRKNIHRAIKNGLKFKEIKDKEELKNSLELIKETYKKVKLPIPDYSFFLSIYDYMFKKKLVKFFAAKYNRQIISVRFVLIYNGLIYDWFAGTDESCLDKYPNDFLLWKVMEWGHENGYKIFQFGGAGKPNKPYGVRDYKLKFGGELVNYGRFEKVHKPLLMEMGKTGLKIWQKLK